jgi:hypothetical protein
MSRDSEIMPLEVARAGDKIRFDTIDERRQLESAYYIESSRHLGVTC